MARILALTPAASAGSGNQRGTRSIWFACSDAPTLGHARLGTADRMHATTPSNPGNDAAETPSTRSSGWSPRVRAHVRSPRALRATRGRARGCTEALAIRCRPTRHEPSIWSEERSETGRRRPLRRPRRPTTSPGCPGHQPSDSGAGGYAISCSWAATHSGAAFGLMAEIAPRMTLGFSPGRRGRGWHEKGVR